MNKGIKILCIGIAICLLVGIGYQIFSSIFNPYQTTVVYNSTLERSVEGNGVMFKDESVIPNPAASSGVVNYLYTNGSRVAAHAQVAKIYQNSSDVLATSQIEQLNHQINQLQQVQNASIIKDADISVLNKELYNEYNDLLTDIRKQNLTQLADKCDNITMLFNKKQIITGQAQTFNDSIAKLNSQKQTLEASITSQPQIVNTDYAGYFVDSTDNMESQCTLAAANNISAQQLNTIFSTPVSKDTTDTIGKVITNPTLMFETVVATNKMTDVKLNTKCTLKFKNYDVTIPAILSDLKIDKNNPDSVASFSITNMTEQLANIRSDQVQIILDSETGLRIPKTAIRTNDAGEAGVYTLNSVSMNFKKLDIIYEDSEYVLSKPHTDDASFVRLYDTIITQGKDLYDNKPV